jgi:hypothetical protein
VQHRIALTGPRGHVTVIDADAQRRGQDAVKVEAKILPRRLTEAGQDAAR